MEVDTDTHCTIQQYLKLISRRASGQIDTTASWIRRFIQQHPAYKYDTIFFFFWQRQLKIGFLF